MNYLQGKVTLLVIFFSFARAFFLARRPYRCSRNFHATNIWARRTTTTKGTPTTSPSDSPSSPPLAERIRTRIRLDHNGEEVSIISRTVVLTEQWNVTVYELEQPAALIEEYWDRKSRGDSSLEDDKVLDPFGLVAWPGAVVAAREARRLFANSGLDNKTVLVLGAGKLFTRRSFTPATFSFLTRGLSHDVLSLVRAWSGGHGHGQFGC